MRMRVTCLGRWSPSLSGHSRFVRFRKRELLQGIKPDPEGSVLAPHWRQSQRSLCGMPGHEFDEPRSLSPLVLANAEDVLPLHRRPATRGAGPLHREAVQ